MFIVNNSRFNIVMTGMLLFTKFVTFRSIWLPQDDFHLRHSIWTPLLRIRTHYFQPTLQFVLSDSEELEYDQARFYQQREV